MSPALWFVVVSFEVCLVSFAVCYAFLPKISIREEDGQLRSLSGIMKMPELKPFFEFIMCCLGGSLYLLSGLHSDTEWILAVLTGMYVSFMGLIKYDVAFYKKVHFGYVCALIFLGGVFVNYEFLFASGSAAAWMAVVYDVLAGGFILMCLVNNFLSTRGMDGYRTAQACVEVLWVLSLVACMLYSEEEERILSPSSLSVDVCLGVLVFASTVVSAVFYLTPDFGYDKENGEQHCLCLVIASAGPHLSFLLQSVFGLLLLCIGRDDHGIKATMAVFIFVFGSGFLGFDIVKHQKVHACFVAGFAIAVLVFGVHAMHWDNPQLRAGLLTHVVTGCVLLAYALALGMLTSDPLPTSRVLGALHIVWILGIVAMFGVYVICA
jgi:hypothetical protein